jgi:hypothetical protein
MSKFLRKWTRIFHRWIAIPTLVIIPLAVIAKFTGDGVDGLPANVEQFQSILMLLLAISGAYLYLIPYLAKWARNKRQKENYAPIAQQK